MSDLLKNEFCATENNQQVLNQRAYNQRWAELPDGTIPLTAADPDFPVPDPIYESLMEYLQGGYLSYGPPAGLPEFREAAANRFSVRDGIELSADRIVAIDSAASGMVALARVYLDVGDEMLIFDPVDFLFSHGAEKAGAKTARFKLSANGEIDWDAFESLISPRTKMIGVCQPHNPLGRNFTKSELQRILELARKYDLWILADEIWSDIVFRPGRHISMLSIEGAAERTLLLQGTSKSFGLAGARIGFVALPDAQHVADFLERSGAVYTSLGASTLSQIAAIAAWDRCSQWLAGFVDHLQLQRDFACDRLKGLAGVSISKPDATFVLFPDISNTGWTAEALSDHLKHQAKVAVVPGSERWFGPGAIGHIRLSLATTRDILSEAFDRIESNWPV
ncbi:MAG: pyridoxal phosphate-dependent aminotransferase [Planctomycetaceae bacterium]|nr:pyridoxal phosphate-dependent aminotransferase [Planctomycetaceae bacterium]